MGPPRPRTRSSLSPVQTGVTAGPRPRTRSSLSPVQTRVTAGPRPRTRSSLSPVQTGVTAGSVASPSPLSSPQPGSSRKRKVTTVTTVSKKTSWVWPHFDEIIDEEGKHWSKCKHCEGGRYRCGGKDYGTGNMNYHLRRCSEYLKTKSGPGSELDNIGKEMEYVGVDFSQDACRRLLIKFIVKDEQSFRMVEGEGFRAFCKYLEPRFILPSRMTVYRDICQLFLDEKANLISYFKRNKVRVCLTTDTWTSIQNYNYMVVTAHFIDDHWKLHKRVICFCLITSHEGDQIGKALEKCMIEWGLERVFTITLDNASSNLKAIDYVRERVVSWGSSIVGGKFLHVRCVAHILALVVKDGMKKYHVSVRRIRSVVKFVTSSPARLKRFLEAVSLERIECKKGLVLDVKTRWNSTYLMLDSAEKYEKAFKKLGRSDKKFFDRFIPDFDDLDGIDDLGTLVRKDFDILYAAYKSENTPVESVSTSSESIGETSASQGSSSFISKKAKHKANRDARKIQLSTVEDRGKSEMERYFAEAVYTPTKDNEDSSFDILVWWKINAARFNILSLIARDVLAIPVSSVASESAFSTGKRILGHFRSSLKPRTVEALILLQNWLRTPIDMDPSSLGDEEEDTAVESEMFGDLSAYSVIVDDDD